MLNVILTATDGSASATRAVEFAGGLAAASGASLVLLHIRSARVTDEMRHLARIEHIVDPAPAGAETVGRAAIPTVSANQRSGAETDREIAESLGQRILAEAETLARRAGAGDIRTLSDEGDPAQRILACAQSENADLIVMGRRGLSDLAGLLIGSVSHKISQLADCACLTVK
jgi:nucleotide-binding universal stress UspA family protein